MYRYSELETVHLEITSKCNARCPMCLRTVNGGRDNAQLPMTELTLTDIQKIFSIEFVKKIKRVYMCGNYGDPIAARDTLEIFRYFKKENPEIRLDMFTNGGARPVRWWQDLARVVSSVQFGIDGLEDTNHLYRRGTQFPIVMKNAQAYIDAGGRAYWDYIVFRHNEHQVEQARELSEKMGFKKFQIKKTGRFFSNVKSEGKDLHEVQSKDGNVEYALEKPLSSIYQNQSLKKEENLKERYGSLESYLDKTPIRCKVEREKSLYISAEGLAFPCCWTANQLYPWYYNERTHPIWRLLGKLPKGKKSLSAIENDLLSVVEGPFFQKILPESWEKESIACGKFKMCAKICGTEFDPFNDQFK